MKKIKIYLTLLFATIYIIACTKDFIVKNIKNDVVTIIAPSDHLVTPYNNVIFWWDELDGAEKYNLQIVKPDFNSVSQLVIDTTITGNKFNYTFTPGNYHWRIKAINSGGSTAYTTRKLIIDTTSNLNLVTVGLITPTNYIVTSNNTIAFSWNPIATATYYELKLTNTTTNSVITISNITGSTYTYSFTTAAEEKYSWQVKAFNAFSQTQNNTIRSFRIDHKAPFLPSLLSPNTYSVSIRDTTYLKWARSTFSTDVEYDIVSISSDSTFSSVLGTQTVTTGTSVRINSMYTYTNIPVQIWWRVNSVDSVDNVSVPNQSKRFYLY